MSALSFASVKMAGATNLKSPPLIKDNNYVVTGTLSIKRTRMVVSGGSVAVIFML
jgi:hypothetical protein